MFLGAGVSKPSGIPEWRELIDLMLKTLGFGPAPENASSFSRLLEQKAGLSLLSQFDLVSHQCKGRDQSDGFVDLLRAHLYGAPQFQELRRLMNAIPVEKREEEALPLGAFADGVAKERYAGGGGQLPGGSEGGRDDCQPEYRRGADDQCRQSPANLCNGAGRRPASANDGRPGERREITLA